MESERPKRPVKPANTPAEVFAQWLDGAIAELAPDGIAHHAVPQDELHQEILLPLLPAMLGDAAIRQHWRDQKTSGIFTRLEAHLHQATPRPEWRPADFEIHVAASYRAGADAKALADTLLSEESLRDLTTALLNQLADAAWEYVHLPPPAPPVPVELPPEIPATIPQPAPEAPLAEPVAIESAAIVPRAIPPIPTWNPLWRPLRRPGWIGGGGGFEHLTPNPLALRARGRLVWRAAGRL